MDLLLTLAGVACLSLFLAHVLRRSASLMPLVALCLGMVWFTVFGMLGGLQLGGWLWTAGCVAALVYLIYKLRGDIAKLITPGFVLFVGLSALFIVLFSATQPMLTQWDEFTVWGTAGRVVVDTNELYTTARSNLIARYQPPGLAMLGYMMQFFGRYAEYKLIASYAILYVAAFAAATAVWDKSRTGSVMAMGTLLLLPILFQLGTGEAMYAYLSVMADMPMAALFGGALCVYYAGGEKDGRLLAMVAIILAALTNLKDMGFAFALVALVVMLLDVALLQRKEAHVYKVRRWGAVGLWAGGMLAAVVAAYGGWALHLGQALGTDRTNVGAGGAKMTQMEMLWQGLKALLRIAPNDTFDARASAMVGAFVNRRVWLLGSGLRILLVILAVSVCAWVLAAHKSGRRRVLLFTGSMAAGCMVYHIFLIITYTFVFSEIEGPYLIGYDRYIFPYWLAWLAGAMVLLWQAAAVGQTADAAKKKTKAAEKTRRAVWTSAAARRWGAGVTSLVLCVALVACVGLRGNWQANFMRQSPSMLGNRLSVQAVLQQAEAEGMRDDDVVYLISQGDNAARFYMFAYEMKAELSPLYGGEARPDGTTAASLVAPGDVTSTYMEAVQCSPQQLAAYLKEQECTHILLDVVDEYVVDEQGLGSLFSEELSPWLAQRSVEGPQRYYRIEWQGEECRFVPVGGEAA